MLSAMRPPRQGDRSANHPLGGSRRTGPGPPALRPPRPRRPVVKQHSSNAQTTGRRNAATEADLVFSSSRTTVTSYRRITCNGRPPAIFGPDAAGLPLTGAPSKKYAGYVRCPFGHRRTSYDTGNTNMPHDTIERSSAALPADAAQPGAPPGAPPGAHPGAHPGAPAQHRPGYLLGGITGKGFMPGKSGNPKGRSKERTMKEDIRRILAEIRPGSSQGNT